MFLHPPWMVGIMLILGVLSLAVGLTIDPFWLVMGSPAILTLFVYLGVRVVLWRRTVKRQTVGRSPTPALERSPELERAADDESVRHGDP